jgi:hypothetical protein
MGGPAAALAGDWGLEVELELAGDASDFAFDAEDEALTLETAVRAVA